MKTDWEILLLQLVSHNYRQKLKEVIEEQKQTQASLESFEMISMFEVRSDVDERYQSFFEYTVSRSILQILTIILTEIEKQSPDISESISKKLTTLTPEYS